MRSWTSSPRTFAICALLSATALCAPSRASAEEALPAPPLATEAELQAAPPAARTTITVTTQAPPAYTPPPAYAPPPPAYAPPPPPPPGYGAAQGPMYFNGPVYVYPAPVTGQPMGQLPALPPPPVLLSPPLRPPGIPIYRRATCCATPLRLRATRGPSFAMGLRFTSMGINQDVFDQKMNLMGGGLQLRLRNQGHWGFETAFDILYANIGDGAFKRSSFPLTVGAMLYLFRNRPETHFNVYGVVAFGLQASDVVLYDKSPGRLNQQFLEVLGQAGGGVELRFNKLAITADIRAVGARLDESSSGGAYYGGVDGGPIPASSTGYKANIGTLLWF